MSDTWGTIGRLGLAIGGAIIGSYFGGIYFGPMGQSILTGVGFASGSFLGSYLFPIEQKSPSLPRTGEYPIQGAYYGTPIPIVYGTCRLAGNVIWIGDLITVNTKHSAGGGGKNLFGGGGGEEYVVTTYKRSFLIAVCEGRTNIVRVWSGKDEIDLDRLVWYSGGNNTGLSAIIGEDYAEYKDVSCAYFEEYNLGPSQAMPNFIFEVTQGSFSDIVSVSDQTVSLFNSNGLYFDIEGQARLVQVLPVSGNAWVALPLRGHDFQVGEYLRVEGSTNYDSDVDPSFYPWEIVDTNDNEIIIVRSAWVAGYDEVFDGTELITRVGTKILAAMHLYGVVFFGRYLYSSCFWDVGEPTCLSRINVYTWAVEYDFFEEPPGGWIVTEFGVQLELSSDRNYLYLSTISGAGTDYMYKYRLEDGAFMWKSPLLKYAAFEFTPSGQLLVVTSAQDDGPSVLNLITGAIDTSYLRTFPAGECPAHVIVSYIDEYTGLTVNACFDVEVSSGVEVFDYPVSVSIDDWPDDVVEVDNYIFYFLPMGNGNGIGCVNAFYHEGYVYSQHAAVTHNGVLTNIIRWKFTVGVEVGVLGGILTIDATYTQYYKANLGWLYVGKDGNIWGTFSAGSQTKIYDEDLNEIKGYDLGWYPLLAASQWYPNIYSYDANPSDIIKDMLLNKQYGAGMDVGQLDLDSFGDVYDYCNNKEIRLSLVVDDQKPIYDWVDFVCSHFGGYRTQHDGKFALGIYRDETSIFTVESTNLVVEESQDTPVPPVNIQKRKYSETFNRIEIVWTNRAKTYAASVAIANDEVDQRLCNQIRKKTVSLVGITNAELAQRTAYRILIESMYRFSLFTFTLSYENMLLEVGDVGTLSDGFLVDENKIRILSIGEDVNGRGLNIEAVEERSGFYPSIIYPESQTGLWTKPEPPLLMNSSIYFRESQTDSSIHLSIVPGNANVGGWYIFRSYDGISYDLVGMASINGVTAGDANSAGVITTALSAASSVVHRKDESFEVYIGVVTDLDTAITDDAFFNNLKLARIEDEIIAYLDCEEPATEGFWTVTNLIRGLFGTEAVAHSAGASFVTLDSNFAYHYNDSEIGKTLYFKAAVFYGNKTQEITLPSYYSVQVQGKLSRPDGVGLLRLTADENDGGGTEYSGASFTLYWNLPGERGSGFNHGGFDLDTGGEVEWRQGDDELDLQGGNGINYGYYEAIALLQDIKLEFYESDGTTLIGTRNILATAQSETIVYATDLNSNDTAVIKVIPRTDRLSLTERSITVTKV